MLWLLLLFHLIIIHSSDAHCSLADSGADDGVMLMLWYTMEMAVVIFWCRHALVWCNNNTRRYNRELIAAQCSGFRNRLTTECTLHIVLAITTRHSFIFFSSSLRLTESEFRSSHFLFHFVHFVHFDDINCNWLTSQSRIEWFSIFVAAKCISELSEWHYLSEMSWKIRWN